MLCTALPAASVSVIFLASKPGLWCPGEEIGQGCLHHRGPEFFPSSQFMIDASNPTQLSAACAQLLGLLSAEPLAEAQVLILFNKTYGPASREGAQRVPGEGVPWNVAGGGPLGRGAVGVGVGCGAHFDKAPLSLQ